MMGGHYVVNRDRHDGLQVSSLHNLHSRLYRLCPPSYNYHIQYIIVIYICAYLLVSLLLLIIIMYVIDSNGVCSRWVGMCRKDMVISS